MRYALIVLFLSFSSFALADDPDWLRSVDLPDFGDSKVEPIPAPEPEVSFLGLEDGVEVIPFSGDLPLSKSMVEIGFVNVRKILSLPLHGYREGLRNPEDCGVGGAVRVPVPFVVGSVGGVKVESRGFFVSDGVKIYEGCAGNWSVYEVHHVGYKIVGVFRTNESLGVLPREESRLRAIEEFDAPIEDVSSKTPVSKEASSGHVATHLIVYSAKWCGPCQRVKPKFLKLKSLGYRVEIRDYDKIPKGEYRPRAVPEIHLFKDGKKVSGHGLNAFSPIEQFKKALELPSDKIEA
jgi:thiol-disulfide isomerase/thioredoxin